jgi:hypothetical protein
MCVFLKDGGSCDVTSAQQKAQKNNANSCDAAASIGPFEESRLYLHGKRLGDGTCNLTAGQQDVIKEYAASGRQECVTMNSDDTVHYRGILVNRDGRYVCHDPTKHHRSHP